MLKGYYQLTLTNKSGKVVHRRRRRLSHSFVLAMLDGLYIQQMQLAHQIKDIGGVNRNMTDHATNFKIKAIAGVQTYGIVVGTGDTPPANEDYRVDSQIDSGTGAGELEYGVQSAVPPAIVGFNVDLVLARPFVNNGPGDVLVKSIGLYSVLNGAYYFCTANDVLDEPDNVEPTQTLTVTYILRTSA